MNLHDASHRFIQKKTSKRAAIQRQSNTFHQSQQCIPYLNFYDLTFTLSFSLLSIPLDRLNYFASVISFFIVVTKLFFLFSHLLCIHISSEKICDRNELVTSRLPLFSMMVHKSTPERSLFFAGSVSMQFLIWSRKNFALSCRMRIVAINMILLLQNLKFAHSFTLRSYCFCYWYC